MSGVNVPDTWQHGDPYEQYVGRWSRPIAAAFVVWLDLPPGCRWLDVGCGTGAVSSAVLAAASPASVVGVEPSDGFLVTARQHLAGRVVLKQGSATELPLPDHAVDAVVSGLVLNFVPDQAAAMAEMARVCVPGGTIAAYVWDYSDRMEVIRYFWDAAVALDPDAARLDEGLRFPVCHPSALRALFEAAGLRGIVVHALETPTRFSSVEDYWRPFLGGQGPAPAYAMSLDDGARARLRAALEARLPVRADGSVPLVARAWAVRGTLPS